MGLGLTTGSGSGDIKPFCKYDARAGRMFRVDRFQNSSAQWETSENDITSTFAAIVDLANIRVGWVNFTTQGPIMKMVKIGEPMPPRPADMNSEGKPAFRQGFETDMLLANVCGGGPVRKFGSSAGCVIEAVDALHTAYSAAPEAAQGKLPIVQLTETKAVKSGQSTNYKPTFAISGWVPRPAELSGATAQHSEAKPATSPPSTGSTQASPPMQAPQPAAVGAEAFG